MGCLLSIRKRKRTAIAGAVSFYMVVFARGEEGLEKVCGVARCYVKADRDERHSNRLLPAG